MKQDLLLELLDKQPETSIGSKVWAEAARLSKIHSDTLLCISAGKIRHKSREFTQPIICFPPVKVYMLFFTSTLE